MSVGDELNRTLLPDSVTKKALLSDGERPPIVSYRAVSKAFGRTVAVRNVHLDILEGEFVCIVGPSGCGKSTLLNMLAGLYPPSAGTVEYRGHVVDGLNRDVGYITQQNLLLPWRTVEGNIRFALELRKVRRQEIGDRTERILRMVGLTDSAKSYPYQLSGGMQKRVAIGRVLAYSPAVLMMDEPFASLDAQLRLRMHEELLDLWQNKERNSVVFVTHDLGEAITLGDRVIVMAGQPGCVVKSLDIEIDRPRDVLGVQAHPHYGEYFQTLWNALGQASERT